jgi:hypothetical protein
MEQDMFLRYEKVEGTLFGQLPFLVKEQKPTCLAAHNAVSVCACVNIYIFRLPIFTKLGFRYYVIDCNPNLELPTSINNNMEEAETKLPWGKSRSLNMGSSNDTDPTPQQHNSIVQFS